MHNITAKAVFAGQSTFTVANNKGEHYTFRIEESEGTHFAKLLTGSNNEADYTYLGILKTSGEVVTTRKSKMSKDSVPVKVLAWTVKRLLEGKEFPEGYSCLHDGSCSRCGRTLTHPDSLMTGLGPECAKKA